MIVIGLTGSIGMGKSTTARMFADAGIPVHDSDEAVHRIYEGPDAALIEKAFPGTLVDGKVDRGRLGERILGDREAMKRLESIVHPLVRRDADAAAARPRAAGAPAVLLDIPLLFETGGTDRVDRIVVVSAPADIQRERVLARPGMTPEKFEAILARQVPDAEKRRRADHVIDTGQGLEPARRAVEAIVEEIRREAGDRA
jgi:dephospho-CoA kinase